MVVQIVCQGRRDAFDLFHEIGNGEFGGQLNRKMNMIRHTANSENRTPKLSGLIFDAAIDVPFNLRQQKRLASSCSPDQMQIDF